MTPEPDTPPEPGSYRRFFFRWTFLTTLAWALWVAIACTPLAIADASVSPAADEGWQAQAIALALLLGALIGGSQWLLLRRHLPTANAWPLATIIGAGIGGGLLILLGPYDSYGVIPGVIVLYVVTGILQGLVLSREAAQIIAWMGVMFIASLLVIFFGSLGVLGTIYLLNPFEGLLGAASPTIRLSIEAVVGALPFGLVYALVTGAFMGNHIYPENGVRQAEPTGAQ